MKNKMYGLIGLARRAGRLLCGLGSVVDGIRGRNVFLVIISEDASDSSKKKITDKCGFYNVKYIFFGSMNDLGRAIGYNECTAVAITDKGFADSVSDIYNKLTEVALNGSC